MSILLAATIVAASLLAQQGKASDYTPGRYQPRLAAEVLRGEYGDCTDKHTRPAT